jgi:hypothetical protein
VGVRDSLVLLGRYAVWRDAERSVADLVVVELSTVRAVSVASGVLDTVLLTHCHLLGELR